MRKNIYNDKILMIEVGELEALSYHGEFFNEENEEVLNKIEEYLEINDIKKYLSDDTSDSCYNKEIALSLEDKVNKKIEEVYEKYTEEDLIFHQEMYNALRWAFLSNANLDIIDALKCMFDKTNDLTMKEVRNIYGRDILNYILSHREFDYKKRTHPIIESDKVVLLVINGELKEIEVESIINQESISTSSYQKFGKYLECKMGNKIDFQKRQEVEKVVQVGEYHRTKTSKGIPFYYEFIKDDRLSIEVSSFLKDNISINEKLLVLRDFYEILRGQYGEPSMYSIQRDNKKEALDLDWNFRKKENVSEIRSDVFFPINNMEIVDCYVVGVKEGSFNELVDKQLQESDKTPLYDNDLGLEKKPTKP